MAKKDFFYVTSLLAVGAAATLFYLNEQESKTSMGQLERLVSDQADQIYILEKKMAYATLARAKGKTSFETLSQDVFNLKNNQQVMDQTLGSVMKKTKEFDQAFNGIRKDLVDLNQQQDRQDQKIGQNAKNIQTMAQGILSFREIVISAINALEERSRPKPVEIPMENNNPKQNVPFLSVPIKVSSSITPEQNKGRQPSHE